MKLVFSPKRRAHHEFDALPHHKKLMEAGARPGDRVVVKGVEYVVRSRQLKNARLLGVERADKAARMAAAAAAGPARSPLVPKVGKRDQVGDEVEYKGRRFRLQKKAKARRWVKIAGPAFPKRAAGQAAGPAAAAAAASRSSSRSTQTALFGTVAAGAAAASRSRSSSRRRRRLASLKRRIAARRIQGAFRRRRAAKGASAASRSRSRSRSRSGSAAASRSRSGSSRSRSSSQRRRRLASLKRRMAARRIKGALRAFAARRAGRTLVFSHLPAPKELKARKARVGQRIMVGEREYVVGEQRVGDKVLLRARKITGSEKRRRKAEQQRLEAEFAMAELGAFPMAPAAAAGAGARSASSASLMRRLRSLKVRPAKAPPSDVVLSPGCLSFVLKASCRQQLCGAAKSKSKSKSKSRSKSRTPPGGAVALALGSGL
jgi:hypothetical protein